MPEAALIPSLSEGFVQECGKKSGFRFGFDQPIGDARSGRVDSNSAGVSREPFRLLELTRKESPFYDDGVVVFHRAPL